jgi:hypothetical protein
LPSGQDLQLDELLGERYVQHYLRILRSANSAFWVTPDPEAPDRWTTTVTRPPEVVREALIDLRGGGPAACSSSTALQPWPSHSWDVRGYYARLGVPWTATRAELRDAYAAAGGPEDEHLTYAFKQLINDRIRQAYDAVPLDGDWLDDEGREALRREAAREAARRTERSGHAVDYVSVLTERGYIMAARGSTDASGRVMDEEPPQDADPASALGSTISEWETRWGWYMMEGATLPRRPGEVLGPWQQMLIEAFSAADLQVQFAVGFFAGKHFRLWRTSSNLCIVFLANNEPPTPTLATEAVNGYKGSKSIRGE